MESSTGRKLYDAFVCVAGQCQFTCCKGWEISVDSQTYDRWKNNFKPSDGVKNTISIKKTSGSKHYKINMGQDKCCPYFNAEGLCRVVIDYGEEYLPKICGQFPRIMNHFGSKIEYSLSCACPEVVDILWREEGKAELFASEASKVREGNAHLHDIRNMLLTLLFSQKHSIQDRLLLGFLMLSDCAENDIIRKDAIGYYQDEQYQTSLLRLRSEEKLKIEDACLEQNELFLDIGDNYRKEEHFRKHLEPLTAFAEVQDVRDMVPRYKEFETVFSAYDKLVEQCLAIKVYSECVGEDIDAMLLTFQLIVLEYSMLRHSAFLIWLMKGKLSYRDIRDFIVIYSRIIGNNPEGIKDFFGDSFDGGFWYPGYLLLLLS